MTAESDVDHSSDHEGSDSGESLASSSAEDQHGLFDLEASESDGDDHWDHSDNGSELDYFPQFCRLPTELRRRVWEFFCPDLTIKARVLDITVSFSPRTSICDAPFLAQQTLEARTMLAVNRDSRYMASAAFPDTLCFGDDGTASLRINSKTDILTFATNSTLEFFEKIGVDSEFSDTCRDLLGGIVNIMVFQPTSQLDRNDFLQQAGLLKLPEVFPDIRTVYLGIDEDECKAAEVRWCASDRANQYVQTFYEEKAGICQDMTIVSCWPDLEKNRAFAEEVFCLDGLSKWPTEHKEVLKKASSLRAAWQSAANFEGSSVTVAECWPMVRFWFERGMSRLERLGRWSGLPEDWDSVDDLAGTDDDHSSTNDEYESEGIDDGDIEEAESSDEEDDLIVQPVSDDVDPEEHWSLPVAAFSSPEPDADETHGRDDSDESDARGQQPRKHSRRVLPSETDDEAEADEGGGVSLTNNKNGPLGRRRRRRPVLSDSEDETKDETEDGGGQDGKNSEQHEEDDDKADPPLSLAQRLRQHREANPVPTSASDSDSDSDGEVDGYGDEEDSDAEDDREAREEGFFRGAAEETEEDSDRDGSDGR